MVRREVERGERGGVADHAARGTWFNGRPPIPGRGGRWRFSGMVIARDASGRHAPSHAPQPYHDSDMKKPGNLAAPGNPSYLALARVASKIA